MFKFKWADSAAAIAVLTGLLVTDAGGASQAANAGYRLLVLDGGFIKWGKPVLGTGAVVTVAVAETPRRFPDNINCTSLVPIDAILAKNGVTRLQFDTELEAALGEWSRAADITFIAGDPATADILIGAEGNPVGRAFTNIALPTSGNSTIDSIDHAVVCLNPDEQWKVGFDGNLGVYDLRYTLAHEIGHSIGLDHPGATGETMDFRYQEAFRQLQPGDIAGARALYGDPLLTVGAAETMARPLRSQPN